MAQPSTYPIDNGISKLENIVGRLSPMQKILLGTDGSVTSLLEIITGSPVEIETLVQKVVAADEAVAKELMMNPGEDINYRVVKLKNAETGETLIYAVSHAPLKRLDIGFQRRHDPGRHSNRSHIEDAPDRIQTRDNRHRIF